MSKNRYLHGAAVLVLIAGSAGATITVDTTVPTDWKISNGVVSLDWNSTSGNIYSIHLAGHPEDIIDVTNTSGGRPKGFYMDNTGLGAGVVTANFHRDGDRYVDWWTTVASNPTNPFTYSQHFLLSDNDSGIHAYFVVGHGAGDIAGAIGQVQFVFRVNLALFPNTYSVNSGLGNLGPTAVTLPPPDISGTADPGRQVQDATVDLHGFSLPDGFRRQFYTKYDYSSYEYLHKVHGVFGSTLAAWTVLPSTESLIGGPTKQDLIFTNNILIMECQSNHLNNGFAFPVAAGDNLNRLYGPFYFRFNAFDSQHTSPDSLYQEALGTAPAARVLYDSEDTLLLNGYVPSNGRAKVRVRTEKDTWVVLSDPKTNFQYSHLGGQYWANSKGRGAASMKRVIPGTYRLSAYVLGEWGELRRDDVSVAANQTATVRVNFTPENFGSAPPVWTIGTPDRSAHEFLHGQVPGDNSPQDDREYWGNWDYWADFADNRGAVIYYGTPVGSTPATNDLGKWNYIQWHNFSPGLYAGIYNASDDTTGGYKYRCPSYAGNCATASVPDWQVHFTTTPDQRAQGRYVALSVGVAASESNLTVSLNGNSLVWRGSSTKYADAQVRSGFAGTYQWVVFQWDASQLNAPGVDNVLTFSVNRSQGVMYDALRMEITDISAAHEARGWSDYEYVAAGTYQPADDTAPNQF